MIKNPRVMRGSVRKSGVIELSRGSYDIWGEDGYLEKEDLRGMQILNPEGGLIDPPFSVEEEEFRLRKKCEQILLHS